MTPKGMQIIYGQRAVEYNKLIDLFRGCLH